MQVRGETAELLHRLLVSPSRHRPVVFGIAHSDTRRVPIQGWESLPTLGLLAARLLPV